MTEHAPADVVRRFCDEWRTITDEGGMDRVLAYFTDDAEYHNMPVEPVHGPGEIRSTLEGFLAGVTGVEFEVRHLVADGPVVLTERVDWFHLGDGRSLGLPVMGTFELTGDGKIAAWRDYFDLNRFMTELAGG
jgi:limonene-1,2-epoxide hydrolase